MHPETTYPKHSDQLQYWLVINIKSISAFAKNSGVLPVRKKTTTVSYIWFHHTHCGSANNKLVAHPIIWNFVDMQCIMSGAKRRNNRSYILRSTYVLWVRTSSLVQNSHAAEICEKHNEVCIIHQRVESRMSSVNFSRMVTRLRHDLVCFLTTFGKIYM